MKRNFITTIIDALTSPFLSLLILVAMALSCIPQAFIFYSPTIIRKTLLLNILLPAIIFPFINPLFRRDSEQNEDSKAPHILIIVYLLYFLSVSIFHHTTIHIVSIMQQLPVAVLLAALILGLINRPMNIRISSLSALATIAVIISFVYKAQILYFIIIPILLCGLAQYRALETKNSWGSIKTTIASATTGVLAAALYFSVHLIIAF